MEARSVQRYVRIAPRKMRVVADLVRNKPVALALDALELSTKRAAFIVRKALTSAIANAKMKGEIDLESLFVSRIFVDEGPTLRRFKPRAMGRATRINKRTSHLTVEVSEF